MLEFTTRAPFGEGGQYPQGEGKKILSGGAMRRESRTNEKK
jgi:hypothetical protein